MKLSYDVLSPPGDQEKNLPPVIMLHGMLDSRKSWKYVAPKVCRNTGRKVYVVDARNHGESPWNDDFTFDILADDLDQFMDDHNIPKAALVGHSMGGRTALTLALRKPDKVEKLIVEDITPENFSPRSSSLIVQLIMLMKESLNMIPEGAEEDKGKLAIIQFMRNLLPPEQLKVNRKIDLEMIPLKKEGTKFSWKANLDIIEDMLTSDKIRQKVAGVYMGDALFMYGTKSFFKVAKDPLIPKLFPRVVKLPFEDATHLIHHEFPREFERAASEFINGRAAPLSKY